MHCVVRPRRVCPACPPPLPTLVPTATYSHPHTSTLVAVPDTSNCVPPPGSGATSPSTAPGTAAAAASTAVSPLSLPDPPPPSFRSWVDLCFQGPARSTSSTESSGWWAHPARLNGQVCCGVHAISISAGCGAGGGVGDLVDALYATGVRYACCTNLMEDTLFGPLHVSKIVAVSH